MSKTVQNDSKNHYNGNPICQRSNRLSRGGIGVLPLKQLYIFNIIKDHAYTYVRTQKGQRSQNVSTALSVAFITLQLYIMKNEHQFIFGHSHLHNMQFRQQNYYKFLTCARKFKKKIIFKAILHFFLCFFSYIKDHVGKFSFKKSSELFAYIEKKQYLCMLFDVDLSRKCKS